MQALLEHRGSAEKGTNNDTDNQSLCSVDVIAYFEPIEANSARIARTQ